MKQLESLLNLELDTAFAHFEGIQAVALRPDFYDKLMKEIDQPFLDIYRGVRILRGANEEDFSD